MSPSRHAQTPRDLFLIVLVVLTVLAALARLPRLQAPPHMVFDEIYYAKAAQQVLAGVEVTEERTHPPMARLIIAAAIRLAGDRALGWRVASAVAGVLLVVIIYALAWMLFRDRFVAVLSAFLVAIDGLVFVESRIAKPDILLVVFLFGAYAAFLKYLLGLPRAPSGPEPSALEPPAGAPPRSGRRVLWVYLAGLAAGCAVSTKWTTVVPLLFIPAMVVLLRGWRRDALPRGDLRHLAAAFLVLPPLIYMLTYIPYFALGHSLRDFVQNQVSMFRFHATLTQGHPYQSPWWSWPLLYRPIWYEYKTLTPQATIGILAIGNPVIWWASIPAFILVVRHALRTRAMPEMFLVAGVVFTYTQYALVQRVVFLYHFMPTLPFLIMGLAVALARLRAQDRTSLVVGFLALAVVWFVAYYPVLAAVPVGASRIFRLLWFGTWI